MNSASHISKLSKGIFGLLIIALAGYGGYSLLSILRQPTSPAQVKAITHDAIALERSSDVVELKWKRVESGLVSFELTEFPIDTTERQNSGGALDHYGGVIIFSSVKGRLGLVEPDGGRIKHLNARVPMALKELGQDPIWQDRDINRSLFRVADIAVVPLTSDSAWLYVSHHAYQDGKMCTRLSRAKITGLGIDADVSPDWQTVYAVDPCMPLDGDIPSFRDHMTGGKLFAEANGRILMAIGDFGFGHNHPEIFENGHHKDWGTLISLDPETGQNEIVATGLRHPQGLTRDPDGRIWETEFGPQGGDEINQIRTGGHLGWPHVTLGMGYAREGLTSQSMAEGGRDGSHAGYDKPALGFSPSVALRQIDFVPRKTKAFTPWAGDGLVVTLGRQTLYRLRTDGSHIILAEPIRLGYRMRDIVRLDDGKYAILADGGKIVLLRDPLHHRKEDGVSVKIQGYDEVGKVSEVHSGANNLNWPKETFRYYCADCHSLDGTKNFGPTLIGIFGRGVGALDGFPYSQSLLNSEKSWSPEQLRAFLRNPSSVDMGGTTMPLVQLTDEEIEGILNYLDAN